MPSGEERHEADYQARFGSRVRELRHARQMSQDDLAQRAGLHRKYVSGVETGRRNPTLRLILALAAGLGVPPTDLLAPFNSSLSTKK